VAIHRGERSIDQADLVAATAQFSWPPAFSSLAVSVQDLMAADSYQPPSTSLADEKSGSPAPVRCGWRSFDRQWLVPDKRVINRPNPSLWQVRRAPGQVYLTALMAHSPTSGPAATFTALVPDLHHYKGSFGGRVWPLWLDAAGTCPNVVPDLLDHLTARYGAVVTGPDIFAYLAAVIAHAGYTERFASDLLVPGLRVPLTADADLFAEAVGLGRRVLWLHTFGERFTDPADDRPLRSPRAPDERRPRATVTIPDTESGLPEVIDYDVSARTLHVGDGRIAPVGPEVWRYEVSGMKVVKRWFDRRKREPEGRRSSPLDEMVPNRWDPDWTSELLDVLNVVTLLVELEAAQASLLDRILAGPRFTVADLTTAGVLPVTDRPVAEKPGRPASRLFDPDG
jgi:hypothetical protein